MELVFPLIGASACILIPGSPHLVTKVFFGTIAFIFGGTLGTIVTAFIFPGTLNPFLPPGHMGNATTETTDVIAFLFFGAASSWLAVRLLNPLLNFASKQKRSR